MNNYEEIEKAFRAYAQRKSTPDKVPDDWFTSRQMAKQKKVDVREAQRYIRKLLDDGLIETKKFNVISGTRLYPVTHYRLCRTKKTG